jgi:uncharacterized protein
MSKDFSNHKFSNGKRGAAFTVRLVTRAQKDEVVGILEDGTIKIRLMASPTDGQANVALVKFLALRLGVPEQNIEILAGREHRDKMLIVEDLSTGELEARMQPDPGVSLED